MCAKSGLIVDFENVQVSEAKNSVSMEPLASERLLARLHRKIAISAISTDRHGSISKMLREKFPSIKHEFDPWHMSKSLKKQLHKAAKASDCEDIAKWIRSACTHLWWAAETCGGDADLLIEKFHSISHHAANVHMWSTGKYFHRCEHGEFPPEEDRAWLNSGSKAHQRLHEIVTNKKFTKDIRRLRMFIHTSALESFHSTMLKYVPKRLHFHQHSYQARVALAVLDHNLNVGRESEDQKTKVEWRKPTKRWVRRLVYKQKSYEWRKCIFVETLRFQMMKTADLS